MLGMFSFWQLVLLLYLSAINLVTFFFFGIDKSSARRGARRTPEHVLYFLILIGGTIGAFFGMKTFRHKTKKASFQGIVFLIMILQLSLVFFLITT